MSKDNPIANAPLTALKTARKKWFDEYGSDRVEKKRYFALAFAALVVIAAQGTAISTMLPLVQVVPYVVKVGQDGSVTASRAGAQKYEPGTAEKQYFLAQWTIKLMTLDRFMTKQYLTDAFLLATGKASAEMNDWFEKNKPFEALAKDPSLTRSVTVRSVTFIQEGAALVRISTEARSMGQRAAERKNLLLTIHYVVIPPTTEKEIFDNPIGLFVTHFDINEDMT